MNSQKFKPKQTEIGKIPEGWEVKELGEFAEQFQKSKEIEEEMRKRVWKV